MGSTDDGDAGLAAEADRLARVFLRLDGKRAAVAALDGSLEAAPQRGLGDSAQAARPLLAGLVHVHVEREAALLSELEEVVELRLEVRSQRLAWTDARAGDHAEYTARVRHEVGQVLPILARIGLDGAERDGLQGDPPGPFVAQPAEHGPAAPGVRPVAVEVGTHGDRAVGKGAGEAEAEARLDVGLGPVLLAVLVHGAHGAGMGAVRVRRPRPDHGLVEVNVPVHQPRPDLAAIKADPVRRAADGRYCGDTPVFQAQVESHQPIGVLQAGQHVEQGGGAAGIAQPHAAERQGGRPGCRHGDAVLGMEVKRRRSSAVSRRASIIVPAAWARARPRGQRSCSRQWHRCLFNRQRRQTAPAIPARRRSWRVGIAPPPPASLPARRRRAPRTPGRAARRRR